MNNTPKDDKAEMQTLPDMKKFLLNLRMQKSQGRLQDTSQIKKIKKDIAVLYTQMNANK
jgi:ribosomal protein L29